jgi:hypothetical protein
MGALVLEFLAPQYRVPLDELVDLFSMVRPLLQTERNHRNAISDLLPLQFKCNNFNVSDGEMRTVGAGLYPVPALINHSCAASPHATLRIPVTETCRCNPNCVAVFNGSEVAIRAVQSILPGEEVHRQCF